MVQRPGGPRLCSSIMAAPRIARVALVLQAWLTMTLLKTFSTCAVIVGALAITGCPDNRSPLEKAGDKIDDAVEKVGDVVDKDGPLEKAGEKVDDAVEDVKDSVE